MNEPAAPTLVIKAGREKSLLRRHPWVFSGAVKTAKGTPQSGDTVRVVAEDGRFLCWAAYSEKSQIVARAWTFDEHDTIDEAFLRTRLCAAVARRADLSAHTDAMRLVHAESDGLPGLVADRYGAVVVLQLVTAGIDPWRACLAKLFMELPGVQSVYERSDVDVRELEGLPPVTGLLAGEPLNGPLCIHENDLHIDVDIANGHKTGFYLDQRDNRHRVQTLANGQSVLNCFCYTGTMSLAALKGGAASVLSIDSSAPSLAIGRSLVVRNHLDSTKAKWLEADVFAALRKLRDQNRHFDFIILDPPKFAPTAHHAEKAARAYKDINLLGFKLLNPGGWLMTFSCSGGVSHDLFQKIVAGAALDANADAQIVERLGPGADHAVCVHFPEGDYLKGLLLRRMS
jgi:23S rRNA (cytosine1962-C5)-methyltransferase